MHGSRGCFGCCTKPTLVIAVDEPSKGLRFQAGKVNKSSMAEDFWSTSTDEVDNTTVLSQRSISPDNMSNQPPEPSGSTVSTSEFVNHGPHLWNQTRQQWLANKRSEKRTEVREPTISWNATYENFLGSDKPFPRPIPLPEMIDFLVDVWEQDGLYD